MSKYNLPNLSKIKLPTGSEYRLTDKDLREMVNVKVFATGTAYTTNEIIYYPNEDTLYRVTADFTGGETLDKTKVTETNISKEIEDRYNEIKSLIAGGTHYRGKTTTELVDGSTTNPIIIEGQSYTAEAGDIVIYDFVDDLKQTKELEFIWSGTQWNEFGSTGIIRALAFADTASGEYTKPTGEGSTTINVYELTGNNSTATTVTGATDVEYVNGLSGGTYTFNTDAVKNVTLTSSAEDSPKEVIYDLSDDATTTFNTDAIKSASLTGTTTFVTSAIGSVELTSSATTNTVVTNLTGTTSFATLAYEPILDAEETECLSFTITTNATFGVDTTTLGLTTTDAATNSVGITTTAASTASFGFKKTELGIDTDPAATATFDVTTKHIHFTPSTTITGVTVNVATDTVTVYPDTAPTV